MCNHSDCIFFFWFFVWKYLISSQNFVKKPYMYFFVNNLYHNFGFIHSVFHFKMTFWPHSSSKVKFSLFEPIVFAPIKSASHASFSYHFPQSHLYSPFPISNSWNTPFFLSMAKSNKMAWNVGFFFSRRGLIWPY